MRDSKDLNGENLTAMLTDGRISRREFLRRAAALGVSTAFAGSVLSGTAEASIQTTPKRGGRLILGLNGAAAADKLDPATYVATFMQVMGQTLYNTLVEVDVGSDLRSKPSAQPALAESWYALPGAKVWVFRLQKDVTFHNGKTLTPADVVYSLNHHRKKDSKSGAKSLLASIVEIKATGKYDVTITLDSGNADLPFILSDYHLAIGPEGGTFGDGIGTGAFVLEKFEPGTRAVVKRNPDHFRSNRGFVDAVEIIAINDPDKRVEALVAGSVHLINRVDPKAVRPLARNRDIQLFEISGGAHYCFPMRCDIAPFNNRDLRLALKYAIDREQMVNRVLLGHGRVGNDHPVSGYDRFFSSQVPRRQFDPDRAKFHLQKSGHTGPVVLSVSDGAFTGAEACAEIFRESAAAAGINLRVEQVPADGYWDKVWMKKPMCASYWSGRATADLMFSVAYLSDAAWNETFWKRPEFDKLVVEARAELDWLKRRKVYHRLQSMVNEDGGEIIPMFNNTIDAGSSKVNGFIPLPTSEMGGYRVVEKIWLGA